MERVLVTGGTGYIGSTITAMLLDKGHEVTVFDRHREPVPPPARFIQGDIRHVAAILQALDGIDAVIHCAASTLVNESFADPASYWDNNLGGTYTLLHSMHIANVRKIIFSSTAAVYGEPEKIPVDEQHPVRPETPYGASKLGCDTLLAQFVKYHGFSAISFRYFNVAGAYRHQDKWIAGWRGAQTHLIPNVLLAAKNNHPVMVNGSDYPTADGTCVRDYIHVADLARAHLLALDAIEPGHQVYNLGTGTGMSILQVIQACREVTGKDIPVQTVPRRRGDPVELVASADKAAKQLNWKPEHDLRDMASDAWEFMCQ